MKYLEIGHIEIGGEVDSDGEICIDVPHYQYINKDQAKQIIEHLQKVFNLGVDNAKLLE
jgi:hypothetical protein